MRRQGEKVVYDTVRCSFSSVSKREKGWLCVMFVRKSVRSLQHRMRTQGEKFVMISCNDRVLPQNAVQV